MGRERPLQDIKVLDLSIYLSGPFLTMLMAGFGAEVIKVERPLLGDPVRMNLPYAGPDGITFTRQTAEDMSIGFLKRGRNKKSITLNLRSEKGKNILCELVKKVDVVTSNFTPGVMDRLGIGYEKLKTINPGIIYCTISGFGNSGPYRELPAFDLVVQAMSGVMYMTGDPESPPVKAGIAVSDYCGALSALSGILIALHYKKRTGKGQEVDISMMDALFSFLFDDALDVYGERGIPVRDGNRTVRLTPFNVYQTKDGYVAIATGSDEMWANLLSAMGMPELKDDLRYKKLDQRAENVDEVDALIKSWTLSKTNNEVVRELRKFRVPCGPVNKANEMCRDPQLISRGMVKELHHPLFGKVEGVCAAGLLIQLSETPGEFTSPAPLLGQHNEEIYSNWLGLSREELGKLKEEGII
jgi:formyl-CoA transferase